MDSSDFSPSRLRDTSIVVFGNPRGQFMVSEFAMLRDYVKNGGSLLIMLAEGRSADADSQEEMTNLNYLLEEFGIAVNADCVVRAAHYKYLHPKEASKIPKSFSLSLSPIFGNFQFSTQNLQIPPIFLKFQTSLLLHLFSPSRSISRTVSSTPASAAPSAKATPPKPTLTRAPPAAPPPAAPATARAPS